MPYGDFDKLAVKFVIKFDIVAESPISIRSGKSFIGPIDNPIIRIRKDGVEVPYIPGSSLKGVLRGEAERYAKTLGYEVCDVLNPAGENGELEKKEQLKEKYQPCIICRIFGGPTLFSHVMVYDAHPKGENSYSTSVMRRVTINRITAAQMPGRLFDVEFVNPGSRFEGRIDVENIDILSNESEEAKIFNYVFSALCKNLLSIGGMKSVGMGSVKIEGIRVEKYQIKDGRLGVEDATNEYLKRVNLI
ncbi:MAG: RAMP superfamily CRISPR-associated protein [Nitrososphaerota archaeon]